MKHINLLCLSIIFTGYCSAQNTFPPSGNAGIGTLAPLSNLHIKSSLSRTSAVGIECQ